MTSQAAQKATGHRAVFSPCRRYRYRLGREWPTGEGEVLFVMLNPSTADAWVDDSTIRRCIGFAQRWGFQRLAVGNLFAWRATDPAELREASDPVGPENDYHLTEMSMAAEVTIAAWGGHGSYRDRWREVLPFLCDVEHLGLTKGGHPKHPLYLRNDVARVPMSAMTGKAT